MIDLMTNLGKRVFNIDEEKPLVEPNFQFVKSRKGILKGLTNSREKGTVIGIYSPALGEGMFITSVDDICNDDSEQIVVLKRYDLSGLILQRTNLSLSEIKAICAFDVVYKNPVLH